MSAKTKIVVLHMRKLVFTGIMAGLVILALIFLVTLVHIKKQEKDAKNTEPAMYVPGVYTSSVMIDESSLDVAVTVDSDHINSISFVDLDEDTSTMYPLVEPSLDDLSEQILSSQSLVDVTYSKNNQYTSQILLEAISEALKKASPE